MGSLYWLLVVGLSLSAPPRSNASNILGLFPHHGYSHFKVFFPILRGLAERGHQVTAITYIKSPEPHPNYEELLLAGKETVNIATVDLFTPTRAPNVLLGEFFDLFDEGQDSCQHFYESGYVEKVLERHKHSPYDLVIMEFFNSDCYLGVPHLLQVPVVGLSSCALMPWYYDRILLPDFPSYVQSEFIGFPEELNWHQRFLNFLQAKANTILYRYYTNCHDNQLIKRYLQLDVDVGDIAKNLTALIFVNQHYSLSGSRPRTPQLIEIGGVHVDERRISDPLPEEVSSFLQNATEDVLFISWGSVLRASSVAAPQLNVILQVLQQLPLKVIWKWETVVKPIESEQFLFIKWAPQLTLLCHPKVKLFWGHGGLLGVTEAVHCGKPLLVTPIYGDQFTNGHAVANRKIGLLMQYNDIDAERLASTLREVMHRSYAENALALSHIFRNRETPPLASALWWIEHLLSNGNAAKQFLGTKAVHLNWFVYYSLDSVALLFAGIAVLSLVVFAVIRLTCARLCRRRANKIKTS